MGKTSEYSRYPETAQDWLSKWDAGERVWSVEMGGIGPWYEQIIQITVAEILRALLALDIDKNKFDCDSVYNRECWESVASYHSVSDTMEKLHLSVMQFGAAKNLATNFFFRGPFVSLSDVAVKDRKILVSKSFPQ